MMTIMAIKSKDLNLDLVGSTIEITKLMNAEPRRIGKIIVDIKMAVAATEKEQTILERAAMTCPVFLSLHPEIQKEISFSWK